MKTQDVQAEIDFFDKIAEHDDSFSEREYKIIFDKVGKYLSNRILEAGCSSGSFGAKAKQSDASLNITGVDINQKFIDMARKRMVYDRLLCANLESKSLFKEQEFDNIFCPFVIHHFPKIKTVINNLSFWIKRGGYIVIVDPNGSNLILRISYLFRKILVNFFGNIKNYASINESHKSINTFKKYLQDYEITLIETFDRDQGINFVSFPFSFLGIAAIIQKFLLKIYKKIPFIKYHGSDLIIVARKK